MNDIVINEIKIEDMIYEIRGVQVMLDSDLAKLYECANGTKTINQAVKRNLDRFPTDFYFQLTGSEYNNLRSQIGTTKFNNMSRTLPYVFTEEGVSMLSSVLRTRIASEVNINIMRAFVKMRHLVNENKDIYISLTNINNKIIDHDEKLNYLFSKFDKKEQLFISGQTYDAISSIIDIMMSAADELIIVDSYADKVLLDLLRNVRCNIVLITKSKSKISETEINRFNEQYGSLKVIYDDNFHDRYFIIDRNTIYHLGASINYAGSKTFSINLLEDKIIKDSLLKYVIEKLQQ